MSRRAPQMKKVPEIPYDALREAVINAVTHRNYFERGANVMVEMFDDRIEITNPGGLVKGLQPEDFGKRSALRNPNIANLLHRIQYIEKMGTGISKIRTLVTEAGLSPVEFEFDTFFTATFRRKKTEKPPVITELFGEKFGVKFGEKFGVKGARLERMVKILETLHKGESLAAVQISKMFHVSTRTVEKDIKLLRENELIIFMGAPKTGRYVLTARGKEIITDLSS